MSSQDREVLTSFVGWVDQIPYAELKRSTFATEFIRLGVASVLIDLGELAHQVGEEVRAAVPGVPWTRIIAMRHVLAHETTSVDYAKVWDAVQDLPRIRGLIAAYLDQTST
jgi:uncharacterized protein with HEPN domain